MKVLGRALRSLLVCSAAAVVALPRIGYAEVLSLTAASAPIKSGKYTAVMMDEGIPFFVDEGMEVYLSDKLYYVKGSFIGDAVEFSGYLIPISTDKAETIFVFDTVGKPGDIAKNLVSIVYVKNGFLG